MINRPSGTITFLFTDIEGSTRLWEQSPAAMGVALVRHNRLLRTAIEQNDGYIFKTMGDAFCAAFSESTDAINAAIEAQRALTQEDWPDGARISVRMALHTGAAELHEDDYVGPPLNRVARLLSAGHGGQVLLSLTTQQLVRESVPSGVVLRDMGDRRLKDLIHPERVYQMVAPNLRTDFPPLKTLDARTHNLPIQSTSFVGREREMEEVKGLLESTRLVTLTGSGGAGKTRLSLQIGADLIDDFADGVWFVPLAPLTDQALVPQAVAAVLGIREQPGVSFTDTLSSHTKDKELLLILDNCEHVVTAASVLCDAVLASSAGVRILASSREALRVQGERSFRVPSLATPNTKVPRDLASMVQYPAIRLFLDRAIAAKPSFELNKENATAVGDICRCLDGIPLAIELAAARLRSMSAEEVRERLDQRFHLLTGGSRTALPRQQTLRALIDWSYNLLPLAEQALLCRLSTFVGGWTLETAEAVCAGPPIERRQILDILTALVDKSLVSSEERMGASRYTLLETVRQYARDRLRDAGDETQWHTHHFEHFLGLAEDAETNLTRANQHGWLDRLEVEHDNLRAALTWSTTVNGDVTRGIALAGALSRFWDIRGYLGEGRARLSTLLNAEPRKATSARAKALTGAGMLALFQGDYVAAQALGEESLKIRKELGDQDGISVSLNILGSLACVQGDFASARALYEQSVAIHRELGNRRGVAAVLSNMGVAASDQGDHTAARALHEESLAIRRDLGDLHGVAISLINLAMVLYGEHDYEGARTRSVESLAISRELGDQRGCADSLCWLAYIAEAQGDGRSATPLFEESLAMRRELGDRKGVAESLEGLAHVAFANTMPARAARIFGAAERLRQELGSPLPPTERERYDLQIAVARAALGDDGAFDVAWAEGRAMTLEQAVELAAPKHVL